jgi:hypothetical protein
MLLTYTAFHVRQGEVFKAKETKETQDNTAHGCGSWLLLGILAYLPPTRGLNGF